MKATQAGLERTFGIIVFGGIYLIQAAVPHMPRGGRIINIGSVASKMGIGHIAAYSAAKAAMDSFTYSTAHEVRQLVLSILTWRSSKLTRHLSSVAAMVSQLILSHLGP